jgi:hypothetical protein
VRTTDPLRCRHAQTARRSSGAALPLSELSRNDCRRSRSDLGRTRRAQPRNAIFTPSGWRLLQRGGPHRPHRAIPSSPRLLLLQRMQALSVYGCSGTGFLSKRFHPVSRSKILAGPCVFSVNETHFSPERCFGHGAGIGRGGRRASIRFSESTSHASAQRSCHGSAVWTGRAVSECTRDAPSRAGRPGSENSRHRRAQRSGKSRSGSSRAGTVSFLSGLDDCGCPAACGAGYDDVGPRDIAGSGKGNRRTDGD